MKGALLFLAYVLFVAFAPLAYATALTVSRARLRDRVFLRALAKDYLRTFPVCALVVLPVLAFPSCLRAYAVALHLVFSLPLALELGHVHLFRTRVGLNTFYSLFVSNARETREFLSQNMTVLRTLALVLVVAAPPFALARLPVPPTPSAAARAGACALALLVAAPFLLDFRRRPEKRKDGYVLNPFANLPCRYFQFRTHYRALQELIARHEAPPFEGIVSRLPADEPQTLVVVIGESSNGHHQAYDGYPRDTNAFTDALGGEMLRFCGVRSDFAQTIPSLEKTITFADAAHPGRLWSKGSIVDYFRDAGFETYWLSNQYALDDTALTAMTAHAHVNRCYNFSGMKRFEKAGFDEALLPDFASFVVGGARRKVFFLHLIGSHSAYVNRYPDAFRHYDGDVPGRSLPPAKRQLVNAYDDSVRYTDWLVARLVDALKTAGGADALVYFSDHGEDIFDSCDDKVLGHSQLANEPMTAIPFMVWLSPRLKAVRPDLVARARALPPGRTEGTFAADGYTLEKAVHTLIDLASLESPDFEREKSIFPSGCGIMSGKERMCGS